MASVQVEPNHGAGSPPWKLYHNPHYAPHVDTPHVPSSCCSPSASCSRQARNRRDPEPPMIIAPDDDDDQGGYGYGAMSSELDLCVARIRDLRAELEFERRMRRKAEALSEALAAELADERRRGEAAEAECRALREEAGATRAEAERALEEERRMLRVAELWREERVQMKLADARAAVEEKLREIDDAVAQLHAAAAAQLHAAAGAGDVNKRSSGCSSPSGSRSTSQQQSPSRSQHGQQSPSRSQPHRRDPGGGGGENPHIRRGIKGFVEFPKAVRLPPREEERGDLVSNLECQRAQLRVLMRHRSPAAGGMGLIGAPENLVV